ncbi:hypothetical protein [Mesobacillus maritimus]|uniref:LPXTG cell wall anchor domain-containing protein n=1 Tax=Mesobacillus maritimus TaxID=1643336 RepID=A0ABS7K898_9BACI|nr:hypothetical protein [Mesobacillus maritimus]MBY0098488.1 hypothetical protein [Mesobacillus maritimus]
MKEETGVEKTMQKNVTNNHNQIKVNNAFKLTINIGDSLNLLGLLLGIFLLRKLFSKNKNQ